MNKGELIAKEANYDMSRYDIAVELLFQVFYFIDEKEAIESSECLKKMLDEEIAIRF